VEPAEAYEARRGDDGVSTRTVVRTRLCFDDLAISVNFESHGHAASLVPELQEQ
jgi:hypothetical protein